MRMADPPTQMRDPLSMPTTAPPRSLDEIVLTDEEEVVRSATTSASDENGGSAHADAVLANDDPPSMPTTTPPRNSDEIVLSDEEEEVARSPTTSASPLPKTKFSHSTNILPKRQFDRSS